MILINKKLFFIITVSLISVSINAQQRVVKSDDSRPVNQSEKRNDRQSELRLNTSLNTESRELISTRDIKDINRDENIIQNGVEHDERPSIRRDTIQTKRRDE